MKKVKGIPFVEEVRRGRHIAGILIKGQEYWGPIKEYNGDYYIAYKKNYYFLEAKERKNYAVIGYKIKKGKKKRVLADIKAKKLIFTDCTDKLQQISNIQINSQSEY